MTRLPGSVTLVLLLAALASAGGEPQSKIPPDKRLGKALDYNGYFPWNPPTSLEAWKKRQQEVREQVLVANGLWPLPAKTPLKATIHGKIARDAYTIEHVFFASYPGHYVTGNLYRPIGAKPGAKIPGVLCPHGHWANGRFFSANEKAVEAELKSGAEKTRESAQYPLQARCAMLARMGCTVFHYDMVGNADSKQIAHRAGFTDPQAELWLQSFMGLQTWNSIRALDFLLSLPEVDAARIGVTGASGGGTQTFILGAIDDRPAVAFPAVMVSTAMQGGCICENASYLRLGTGNIELAGAFAPRPQAMSGARDWTIDIETKGLPELKRLYGLYNADDKVAAKTWKEFGHNYNQVARESMYNWFNKHLKLGYPSPVVEKPFVPVPPKELSVFDAQHPLPTDAVDSKGLRDYMTRGAQQQLAALFPKDAATLSELRRIVGTALRVMTNDALPDAKDIEVKGFDKFKTEGTDTDYVVTRSYLSRKDAGEAVPVSLFTPKAFDGSVVVLVHGGRVSSAWEKDGPAALTMGVLKNKAALLEVDVFLTGAYGDAKPSAINKGYAGYTFGYNRTLLANRVHDILTAVAHARSLPGVKQVQLVGVGEAGPWVVIARALCGDAVARTAADLHQFRFENVTTMEDAMMQPGALKYGGLPAIAALCAPHELLVHNTTGVDPQGWLSAAYQQSTAKALTLQSQRQTPEQAIAWVLGKVK